MRNVAGFALTMSSVFLAVVAVLIQAPSLFYMGTALFALIGGCNLQAWLAVRGLRFDRLAPASVKVGERVTVEISVWGEYRIRRPLITVEDKLPAKLGASDISPSLPVAPAYDRPIETMYQFTAVRRGRYRWSGITVIGTDALGLVTKRKDYKTEPTEIVILPRPIPVSLELPSAVGWGISEADSGQTRGAGLEPRGVRDYQSGDSLRHVHWRSSARSNRLLVKEFEAGTHSAAAFLIQRTTGTDIGRKVTTLDLICGHVAYLAEVFLQQGARVDIIGVDDEGRTMAPHERLPVLYRALATIDDDQPTSVADELAASVALLPMGSVVFVALGVADPALPSAIAGAIQKGTTIVPLLYDSAALVSQKEAKNIRSAVDPEYVAKLRASGTSPIIMPLEGAQYGRGR